MEVDSDHSQDTDDYKPLILDEVTYLNSVRTIFERNSNVVLQVYRRLQMLNEKRVPVYDAKDHEKVLSLSKKEACGPAFAQDYRVLQTPGGQSNFFAAMSVCLLGKPLFSDLFRYIVIYFMIIYDRWTLSEFRYLVNSEYPSKFIQETAKGGVDFWRDKQYCSIIAALLQRDIIWYWPQGNCEQCSNLSRPQLQDAYRVNDSEHSSHRKHIPARIFLGCWVFSVDRPRRPLTMLVTNTNHFDAILPRSVGTPVYKPQSQGLSLIAFRDTLLDSLYDQFHAEAGRPEMYISN